MVYSAVLVSGVLQSQSVMHMHISTLSSILFPYTPLQGFEQDFLRYTAGPYQSSISSIVLCIREEAMAPTPVLLPGKSQGRRSLLGCNPWGHTESGTTERLHFHFPLSCTGEGNGTHSSVLAWRLPGTGEPGGLPSVGLHRVGHN